LPVASVASPAGVIEEATAAPDTTVVISPLKDRTGSARFLLVLEEGSSYAKPYWKLVTKGLVPVVSDDQTKAPVRLSVLSDDNHCFQKLSRHINFLVQTLSAFRQSV